MEHAMVIAGFLDVERKHTTFTIILLVSHKKLKDNLHRSLAGILSMCLNHGFRHLITVWKGLYKRTSFNIKIIFLKYLCSFSTKKNQKMLGTSHQISKTPKAYHMVEFSTSIINIYSCSKYIYTHTLFFGEHSYSKH